MEDSSGTSRIPLRTAVFLVVGNMVGTGVFTSLGFQLENLSTPFAISFLWLLGGVATLCGALAYGELSAAIPRSGGEYSLLRRIYHPAVGFLAAFLSSTVGFGAPIALASMAFGAYASAAFPGSSPKWLAWTIATLVTLLQLGRVDIRARFQEAATGLKILLILLLSVSAFLLAQGQPVSFAPTFPALREMAGAPFAASLVYVMYSYSGWNASVYIAEEVRNPQRTIPLSLAIGSTIVTVLYVGLNAAFLHAAPIAQMRGIIEVGMIAGRYIFGEYGGRIVAGAISLGLLSSIAAMTWMGPRVTMALGEDYAALRWLSRRNSAGVPSRALLFQYGVVVLLLATGTFAQILTYIQFTLTLSWFATVLGVFVLRWKEPLLPRPYRAWGYPWTPVVFLAVCLWMLWDLFRMMPKESLAGLATLLFGLPLYALVQRGGPPATRPSSL
ncbi:Serine/threonine exchanger SteT [Methylacidimicrobium cyclopophantes]|uniref:Serine/threonine exchanger SteT n=1 Tax=Methylacidimicrobium cyclopophantes TaxID=1041766 RepID=A0A5E6MBY9_9BACT|nr:amino acid permease [Methylacidimicrobium cyclopophantes]VVM06955.1 Serine/threonine exchanger SteT [Methylacidimicrobium cyclopophantes]